MGSLSDDVRDNKTRAERGPLGPGGAAEVGFPYIGTESTCDVGGSEGWSKPTVLIGDAWVGLKRLTRPGRLHTEL